MSLVLNEIALPHIKNSNEFLFFLIYSLPVALQFEFFSVVNIEVTKKFQFSRLNKKRI